MGKMKFRDDYSFSDGIKGIGQFDPNALSISEQKDYGKVLGILWDVGNRKNLNTIEAYAWDIRQVDFLRSVLTEGIDFSCKESDDPKNNSGFQKNRYRLGVYNPLITYYFRNPLPGIGPTLEASILSGVLSDVCLRNKVKEKKRIIYEGRSYLLASQIEDFSAIIGMRTIINPYRRVRNQKGKKVLYDRHDLWFLDPREVSYYLIDDFELKDDVEAMPNWSKGENAEQALEICRRFRFKSKFDEMELQGRTFIGRRQELRKNIKEIEKSIKESGPENAVALEITLSALKNELHYLDEAKKHSPYNRRSRNRDLSTFKTREHYLGN